MPSAATSGFRGWRSDDSTPTESEPQRGDSVAVEQRRIRVDRMLNSFSGWKLRDRVDVLPCCFEDVGWIALSILHVDRIGRHAFRSVARPAEPPSKQACRMIMILHELVLTAANCTPPVVKRPLQEVFHRTPREQLSNRRDQLLNRRWKISDVAFGEWFWYSLRDCPGPARGVDFGVGAFHNPSFRTALPASGTYSRS